MTLKANNSEPRYLLQGTRRTLLKVAACSAYTIATVLCIPDGVGILPDAPSALIWAIRLFGLWLSAWVLWFVGFSVLLMLGQWAARGIELNAEGCKTWRYGKFIPWSCVIAVLSEPQPFFSRAFFLNPPLYKLTMYCRRGGGSRGGRIEPEVIPSMQLSQSQYESLLSYAADHVINCVPHSADVLLAREQWIANVRRSYQHGQRIKVGITVLVLLSLSFYMVRKASLNYSYNKGMHEFRLEHYRAAARQFERSAKVDPTFASAWDSLARSEYRLGDDASAERHWRKALTMKPDFVESKIGLANLMAKTGKLADAEQLLRNAIRLSPTNIAAYMNLADVQTRRGDASSAATTLKTIIRHDPENLRARASLIRLYTAHGTLQEATMEYEASRTLAPRLQSDSDFLTLVHAELALAKGQAELAQTLAESLLPRFKNDPALIKLCARLDSMARHEGGQRAGN